MESIFNLLDAVFYFFLHLLFSLFSFTEGKNITLERTCKSHKKLKQTLTSFRGTCRKYGVIFQQSLFSAFCGKLIKLLIDLFAIDAVHGDSLKITL